MPSSHPSYRRLLAPTAALVLLALAAPAGATAAEPAPQAEPSAEASATAQTHNVSVTFSPLHLLMPIVEVTAEVKLIDDLSLAALGGWGSITQKISNGSQTEEIVFDVLELGAQARYYAIGDFDSGMQLGVEALYIEVTTETDAFSNVTISGAGQGVAVGPFIGYKYTADVGFTFDSQLGIQRAGIGAEAEAETGERQTEESTEMIVLLNLNIGWSF